MDSKEKRILNFNFPNVSQNIKIYRNIHGKYSVFQGNQFCNDIDSGEIIRKFKDYINKIIYDNKQFGYIQNSILETPISGEYQIVFGHDDRKESFNVGVVKTMNLNELETCINNFG